MKNKGYELRYNGSNGDCTSSYMVVFNRQYKVEEFVKSILTNKEFGCIKIKDVSVCYDSNLSSRALEYLPKFYDKKIKKCYASGGWGRMDYDIEIDEEVEE